MKKTLIKVTMFVIVLSALTAACLNSLDRSAKISCNEMVSEASSNPKFWITQNQKDQCDFYNISINAPVNG
jgi:hypothetical protein